MTDGTSAPDPGTPDQRPPGWQPPSEAVRSWSAPGATPGATPGAPPGPAPYGYPQQSRQYGYQQPYQQPYQPLYQARPVYKPGTIPLRPLGVGDMFSGAVETIRRNPKATLGLAAVVLTAFMLIPILGALVWGAVQGFGSRISGSDSSSGLRPEDIGLFITTIGGGLLSSLATVVLTGTIVHVVEHAARGQKLSAGDAWALTKPRIWRLLGLSAMSLVLVLAVWAPVIVLIVVAAASSPAAGWIVGVLGAVSGLVAMIYLYIRLFQLAAANVVLEHRNTFAAMRRSWELSRGQFWRLFGITLLTLLVTSIGAQFLSFPFAIVSGAASAIWPDTLIGVLVGLLAQNIAVVVGGALTTPFSASVSGLQYLDQRIRKEGYDIQLIGQVSMPAPVPTPGTGVPGWTA